MKIDVKELNDGETQLTFEVKKDSLGFNDKDKEEIRIVSFILINIKAHKLQERVVLFGSVSGDVELVCARCLEPYKYPLSVNFEVEYKKRIGGYTAEKIDEVVKSDEAFKLHEDEDIDKSDVVEYSGDLIDITDDVRQSIILALPLKPICTDNCRGLCAVCGNNLNIRKCNCETSGNRIAINKII